MPLHAGSGPEVIQNSLQWPHPGPLPSLYGIGLCAKGLVFMPQVDSQRFDCHPSM